MSSDKLLKTLRSALRIDATCNLSRYEGPREITIGGAPLNQVASCQLKMDDH